MINLPDCDWPTRDVATYQDALLALSWPVPETSAGLRAVCRDLIERFPELILCEGIAPPLAGHVEERVTTWCQSPDGLVLDPADPFAAVSEPRADDYCPYRQGIDDAVARLRRYVVPAAPIDPYPVVWLGEQHVGETIGALSTPQQW